MPRWVSWARVGYSLPVSTSARAMRRSAFYREWALLAQPNWDGGNVPRSRATPHDHAKLCFPDGQSALMLVGARLRHVIGTRWGTRTCLDIATLAAGDQGHRLDRVDPWLTNALAWPPSGGSSDRHRDSTRGLEPNRPERRPPDTGRQRPWTFCKALSAHPQLLSLARARNGCAVPSLAVPRP